MGSELDREFRRIIEKARRYCEDGRRAGMDSFAQRLREERIRHLERRWWFAGGPVPEYIAKEDETERQKQEETIARAKSMLTAGATAHEVLEKTGYYAREQWWEEHRREQAEVLYKCGWSAKRIYEYTGLVLIRIKGDKGEAHAWGHRELTSFVAPPTVQPPLRPNPFYRKGEG